jgi:DNA-binding response OmpR family regulator
MKENVARLAKTSREAFEILKREIRRLDIVIVDVDPGAHGLALLEAISGCAERPPIIVVTALEETYMKPITAEHGPGPA